jgi:hypothetical protein
LTLKYAGEPLVSLRLGGDELAVVRQGGIVVVMGPTGAGKTSLLVGMLIAHDGPVVVLPRELPADELAARAIGMQCDASWLDVLTGRVPRHEMERMLMPRLYVLDRQNAMLGALVTAIQAAQQECPGQQVLVAVDYVQILDSSERETRAKVADILAQIDDIARDHRVVALTISQMSRASSRAARNGEALGADSTDGGAESAAIERFATMTLSIGSSGPEREDATRAVDLSIGKGRMTRGRSRAADELLRSVRPLAPRRGCPADGRSESRARGTARQQADRGGPARHGRGRRGRARAGHARPARTDAEARMGKCPRAVARAARAKALTSGQLVEVQRKPFKSRVWLIWTPGKAAEAGIPLANAEES